MNNNYLDKKIDNFINLLSFNDSICLTGEFGSGKTFFIDKAKDKFNEKKIVYCEINAIFHNKNIPLEIMTSIKKTIKPMLLVNTMGIGLFLFNLSKLFLWIIMFIISLFSSILVDFFINDYQNKALFNNFKFILSITLFFIILFLCFIWWISNKKVKTGRLDELKNIKIRDDKIILFIIDDLNRIDVLKQYEFLNNFFIAFNEMQEITNKKYVILMDMQQFKNNHELEILKNFEYTYNLVYNYQEKKQIIDILIKEIDHNSINKEAVENLWKIFNNNNGKEHYKINLDFILINFNDIRKIKHIINKIFDFCKINNFTDFIDINQFFDFRVLEYYDNEIYNIILKRPEILSKPMEELEADKTTDYFYKLFHENTSAKDNNNDDLGNPLKNDYGYFFDSLFVKTLDELDYADGNKLSSEKFPGWKKMISITNSATFEIFVNKDVANDFIEYVNHYSFTASIYDFDGIIKEFENFNSKLNSFFSYNFVNDYFDKKFWFFFDFIGEKISYKLNSLECFKKIINKMIFWSFSDENFNNLNAFNNKILIENEKFVENILVETMNSVNEKIEDIWFIWFFNQIIKNLHSIRKNKIYTDFINNFLKKNSLKFSEKNNLYLINLAKNNCFDQKFVINLAILSAPKVFLLIYAYSMEEYKESIFNELNNWKSWKKCEILNFKMVSKSILNYHSSLECNSRISNEQNFVYNNYLPIHQFFNDFNKILLDIVNYE